MPIQKVSARVANFEEVALGYSQNQAIQEASRCLECKKPVCVDKCPVGIDIPGFIGKIKEQDFEEAVKILNRDNSLPSICGRVCPQESQCEGVCIVGKQGESVAIGRLERFVGDWALNHPVSLAVSPSVSNNSAKIAVIGSGPAGLACAADLAKMGHNVTIFEALHEPGGVLIYGIPEFRLPKEKILAKEIENIKKLGVKIQTNTLVGRTVTIDNLLKEEGFSAVFLGTGAGLPKFMNIPNENANGVFSANEYLTRANLMRASKKDHNTPIVIGEKVCVIGGGNVAMDAARTALRLGSKVYIVYRRGMDELPARLEEVHHAKEEGVVFKTLTNPTEILVKETGWVSGIKCTKMKLGDMDSSGRPSPVPVEGSDFVIDCDIVIMALGTSPNPIFSLGATGLTFNKGSRVIAEESTGQTCNPAIFAGGDIVTGAATVIMAMGAGRTAATAIDKFVKNTQK
ncbi:MAG: NADPH-dependent glutamate synthase [Defluviitaleaceae bacterium]|nr:NADPH-dependent glutamate synthase [Defluviitaleaceae bacterium]